MHSSSPPLLNIYSHDWGRARRATRVTLAHSAASKNIPSDVTVMQQPPVTGRGAGPRSAWAQETARNEPRGAK